MIIKKSDHIVQAMFTELDHNFEEIREWRRYLHQHPELSFKEEKTARYIKEKLLQFGLEVKDHIGGNGLIGVLKGEKEGATIALRADFDALPIQDEKDVPYRSSIEGAMHACGHDGHTSALLGVAKVLSAYRSQLKGNVVFIFQHAEETPPGGAKFMIEGHVLDGVDYVFGAHLDSQIPLGKVAVGEGVKMAAVDKFKIVIKGKGGHGARPHHTIDSIVIGSEIVSSLQKIVSRKIDPLKSAVVTIGVFQAGSAFNVIADTATLEGTVRTFDEEVRVKVKDEIHSIVRGISDAFGASSQIDYLHGYPALFNHKIETEIVKNLLHAVFQKENVVDFQTSMGAEDFAYFLRERPGTYFKVGAQNKNESTHYPHHHPKFDFDERALIHLGKSFVTIVAYYLLTMND